jgi:thiol:disulfide interchange protein DsbC
VPGIYEVRIQSDLVYVDEKGQYLFYSGDLIDMRSQRNLTRERVEELLTIDFKTLPLDLAIQQKIGDGKRVIAVFEDPNCGYCRKLRADLLKLDNVTLYTFPMAFLAPDSETKASKALCAADKVRAWNDLMLSNRVPGNAGTCETSLAKVAELARNLGITGTPVVFFQNGKRLQASLQLSLIARAPEQVSANSAHDRSAGVLVDHRATQRAAGSRVRRF